MANSELNKYTIKYASKSDVGKRRSENQDSVGKFPLETTDPSYSKGLLFIVADGMGGHQRGKEASETAVRVISESFYKELSRSIPDRLRTAFHDANKAIYEIASSNNEIRKMGTTCSALVISGDRAFIAHVGDSRVYRIYKSSIEKLTADHTQVAEMYKRGILTKKEAKEHPSQSVLSRALGTNTEVEVDIIENISLKSGENFLIATDGLAKVKEDEIKDIVLSQSPDAACSVLIDYANQRGGDDNTSVMLVRIGSEKDNEKSIATTSTPRKSFGVGLYVVFILAIGIALYLMNIGGIRDSLSGTETVTESKADDEIRVQYNAAQSYLEEGRLDTALILYRQILRDNPLHIGAIEGVDRVAMKFVDRGDRLRDEGEIDEAIVYYVRASQLQPANDELKETIKKLREPAAQKQLQENATPGDRLTESRITGEINQPADRHPEETIDDRASQWRFPGLNRDEFIKEPEVIRFVGSNVRKKAIYLEKITDTDILVEAKVPGRSRNGSIGIIIGYDEERDGEFFLYSVDHTNTFKLRHIVHNEENILAEITPEIDEDSEDRVYRLKVKSLGPWIMLYENDKMLQAWMHNEIIRGNIGLYADPGVEVQFSNIQIQSALNTLRE